MQPFTKQIQERKRERIAELKRQTQSNTGDDQKPVHSQKINAISHAAAQNAEAQLQECLRHHKEIYGQEMDLQTANTIIADFCKRLPK